MTSLGKTIWIYLRETTIGSLKLCFDAYFIIEKIFWSLLGITGAIFMSAIVYDQIRSWHLNPIMSTREWIKLSEVDFPAITFCHRGNTRMELAERLLKAAEDKGPRMRRIRNLFLRNSVESMMSELSGPYNLGSQDVSLGYQTYCPSSVASSLYCDAFDGVFGYAKDQNITMELVYDEIYNKLLFEDDITQGLITIRETLRNSSTKFNIIEYLQPQSKQWLHLQKAYVLLVEVPKSFLKMPVNMARSIMGQLPEMGFNQLSFKYDWTSEEMDEFHNIFTLPNTQLNLMAISHFYTMNDFGQFVRTDLFDFINNLYLGGVPLQFQRCFKKMRDAYYSNGDDFGMTQSERIQQGDIFMEPTPCSNSSHENMCQTYCKWHESFFNNSEIINKEEFFVIMKHSLPQRKLVIPPLNEAEIRLANKLFISLRENSLGADLASMPLVIFCKDKQDQKWQGDNIGLGVDFCNDFYSTPCHEGLCLTKNMNVKKMFDFQPEFLQTYESNNQDVPMRIQSDRLTSHATFVLNTNAKHQIIKTFSRSNKISDFKGLDRWEDLKRIDMQIHSTSELAQMEKNPSQRFDMDSIELKAGREYFITIKPFGQRVTSNVKELDFHQRGCLNSDEVPELSSLKFYSKQNCRYECKVKFAAETCKCMPWDFILAIKKQTTECDIFGRTCFVNVMKYFTFDESKCPLCQNACEFMKYRIVKIESKELDPNSFFQDDGYYTTSCRRKDLCDYLMDINGTIDPLSWYEILTNKKHQKKYARKNVGNLIILHIDFDAPEVEMNVMDLRYSLYDRIASLGGTIGLCEQITGASFLTIIHLIVLVTKAIFNHYIHFDAPVVEPA